MKNVLGIIFFTLFIFSCQDESVEPQQIQYYETYTISGKILDQDGNPVPEASVTLWGRSQPSDGGIDADANYFYSGLPTDWYIVGAIYKNIPQSADEDTVFSLTQDTKLDLHLTMKETKSYSGIVYDMFRNGVANIDVEFTFQTNGGTLKNNITTNSTGYFEYAKVLDWDSNWQIKINNSAFRFYSENNSGSSISATNGNIRFYELSPIAYEWVSTENGVSVFYKNNDITRAELIVDGQTFTLKLINKDNQLFIPYNKVDYRVGITMNGDIHSINVDAANGSEFIGIFTTDDLKNPNNLKFEFGSINGPTIDAGFGSSDGGASGTNHVWEFIRK